MLYLLYTVLCRPEMLWWELHSDDGKVQYEWGLDSAGQAALESNYQLTLVNFG